MVVIGSHDKALPQQRGKVIAIEMNAAANADGLIGPSASSPDLLRLGDVDEDVEVVRHDRIRKNDHAAPRLAAPPGCCAGGYEFLDPAQKPDRPRLLVVIKKERLMRQPADQVVAAAILYEPRLPHAVQCILKSITMSTILCQ